MRPRTITTSLHTARIRAHERVAAAAGGVDDALIGLLIDAFYARVRSDDMLGAIFAAHIADWAHHLPRMKDFWASIMIEPGRFSGRPMQKHIALGILAPAHFAHWLALWDETVAQTVADPAIAEKFRTSAHRIADSLLTGVLVQRGELAALQAHAKQPPLMETMP